MSINLTKSLLTEKAKEAAEKINSKDKKASNSQIRKFFDDFVLLQSKSKNLSEEEFKSNILPLIAFSEAKMAYSVGRKVLSENFMNLICEKINHIESKKDFDNFMLFYQAVIGYAKFFENNIVQNNSFGSLQNHKSNFNSNRNNFR